VGAPDPVALRRQAARLVGQLDEPVRDELRRNPNLAVEIYFGLTVIVGSASGCGLDASYDRRAQTIRISEFASDSRRRFSCLHEFGHHLIATDDEIQDWLYARGGQHDAATEEQLADAIAATLILPDSVVEEHLTSGWTVRSLAAFVADQEFASREACCVRAAQRLMKNGMVILSKGSDVLFSAPRNLPFRIRRNARQADSSLFARAARTGFATASYESVNLGGFVSGMQFDGQARTTADGYTFSVLTESLAEVDRGGRPLPARWTCRECNGDITGEPWCERCSRRQCPDCGCACPPSKAGPSVVAVVCQNCFLMIPTACVECPNCN